MVRRFLLEGLLVSGSHPCQRRRRRLATRPAAKPRLPSSSNRQRSQSGESITLELARQGGESKTFELAPQPGLSAATPQSPNTVERRQFKPPDAIDADQRGFRPRADDPFSPRCLGAVLEYTTRILSRHGGAYTRGTQR